MEVPHIPHPWIEERRKAGPALTKKEDLGFNGRFALWITKRFGTMVMFYFFVVWMSGWIILATSGVWFFEKDPYPFTFLLFLSNLVQLLSIPILAVGQQVLSKASEKQAVQTFKDAEAILKLQDEIHRLMQLNNKLTEEMHAAILKK